MSYCTKNYITLFFTHEVQLATGSGTLDWIDIVRPARSSQRPICYPQNTMHLRTSPEPLPGSLKISSKAGEYLFDASSSLPVNTTDILVSQSYIPISSFEFKVSLPLKPAAAEKSLVLESLPENQTLPIVLSSSGSKYGFLNPYWIEPVIPCLKDLAETIIYKPMTVDTTIDLVNQDFSFKQSEAILPIIYTADLAYYVARDLYNPNEYDFRRSEQSRTEINIEQLPHAELLVEYESNGNIVSKTRRRLENRGYTPSNLLGSKMEGATLKQTAVGLLALLALRDYDLIFSSLQELIYIWGVLFKNLITKDGKSFIDPDGFGALPDYLPKAEYINDPELLINKPRNIQQIGWLILSIVQVVKAFRNLDPQHLKSLPDNLDLFIRHHVFFISSMTDPGSGWVVEKINEYGVPTDIRDFETLVVCHLAMAESLSITYDSFVHQRAALSYLKILETDGVPDIESFEIIEQNELFEQKTKAIAAKLLFDYRYGIAFDFPVLTQTYINLLNSQGQLPKSITLFLYVISKLSASEVGLTEERKSIWTISRFFDEVQLGLYRSVLNPSSAPTLEESSWSFITSIRFDLFQDQPFNLFAEEAEAYTAFAYQNAKRMWPLGYKWTSADFELARRGVIGSVLYAIGKQTFAWFLQYAIFRQGRSLKTSQAWALDRWGESLLTRRPYLQSDGFFIESLKTKYESSDSTLQSIKDRLNNIYKNVNSFNDDNSITIEEASFPNVVDFLEPDIYTSRPWVGSPEDVRSVLNAGYYPGFSQPGFLNPPEAPNTQPTLTLWSDVNPRLKITAFGFQAGLKQQIENLVPFGVGTSVDFILVLTSFEFTDSSFNLTEYELGADPDECLLTINDQIATFNLRALNLENSCCIEGIEFDDGSLWVLDNNESVIVAEGFECFISAPPVTVQGFILTETIPEPVTVQGFILTETIPEP